MRRPWGLGLRIQGSSLNPLVPPEGGGGVLNVEFVDSVARLSLQTFWGGFRVLGFGVEGLVFRFWGARGLQFGV